MQKIISYLIYKTITAIAFLFSLFPRKLNLLLGKNLGVIVYLIGIRKKVAKINLNIAFSNKNDFEIEMMLINCYRHFGMVIIDFLTQHSIKRRDISDYIVFNNKDKMLLKNSAGGVIMTAHFGNWEALLPAFGVNNIQMNAVIKEQKNKIINDLYIKARSFQNIELLLKHESLNKLYDTISEKKFIGLACDQSVRNKGIKNNFFSKNASFSKGSGIFYSRTNCSIFVVFCILGSDYKYHIFVKPLTSSESDEEKIISDITSQYVTILEKKIIQNPCQYFWFHKKWDKNIYK